MKYVMVETDNKQNTIEAIVEEPTAYVAQFEPIDVVNGKMVAYDEEGNAFTFTGGGKVSPANDRPKIGFVNVGQWEFSKGEPNMVSDAHGEEDKLKHILTDLLTEKVELTKKRFWRPARYGKPTLTTEEAASMSLKELISAAQRLLARNDG